MAFGIKSGSGFSWLNPRLECTQGRGVIIHQHPQSQPPAPLAYNLVFSIAILGPRRGSLSHPPRRQQKASQEALPTRAFLARNTRSQGPFLSCGPVAGLDHQARSTMGKKQQIPRRQANQARSDPQALASSKRGGVGRASQAKPPPSPSRPFWLL
jgi:hypothetical protein